MTITIWQAVCFIVGLFVGSALAVVISDRIKHGSFFWNDK